MRMSRIALMLTAVWLATKSGEAQSPPGRNAKVSPKPGATFKECRNCPDMVVVPPGSFMMGSPADEPERRDNERQHRVTIARAYAIGKTEVTWDQWEACVRDRWCDGVGVENALKNNEDGTPNKTFVDWGRGTRPVVGPSWFDAQTFVGWLNWKTGGDDVYRLPSEAEWEYAARAGTTTAYPWGSKLDHERGNFGGPGPGLGGKAEGRDQWVDQTAPVASFPARNVFEWVEDCYEADFAHAPADGSANKQGNCANRIFRDGTFMSNPYMQRSARRGAPYPATRRGRNYLGFRVAKTLD
jgi:formylglycine-generating enzyme required for sulfatase activity